MVEQRHLIVFRQWGSPADPEKTEIELVFGEDGGLSIRGVDTGPNVERLLGDWDHEYRIDIPSGQKDRFLAAVLRRAMNQPKELTFEELRDMCRSESIPFERIDWT